MSVPRNVWTQEEVKTLLEIFLEKDIYKLFDGKRYKNNETYKLLEQEMGTRGYVNKNAEQIRNKWKSLKSAYTTAKKGNCKSERKECEFFQQLDEILKGRSCVSVEDRSCISLDGLDSADGTSSDQQEASFRLMEPQVDIKTEVIQVELTDYLHSPAGSSHSSTVQEPSSEPKQVYRKRKQTSDIGLTEFLEHQRQLMSDFFKKQQEFEEAAHKRRSEELRVILESFTASIDRMLNVQRTYQFPVYSPQIVPFQMFPGMPQQQFPNASQQFHVTSQQQVPVTSQQLTSSCCKPEQSPHYDDKKDEDKNTDDRVKSPKIPRKR